MNNLTTQKYIISTILLICLLWFPVQKLSGQSANDFEISKNMEIFASLYKELNINYVDGINPSEFMKNGIDAMLDKLDPYTVFIPESELEDYKFMTTGEYGGIGSLIHKQGNFIYIAEPYENAPAHKSGLKAGDKILKVNDKDAAGKSVDEVSSILKGQPGTRFKLLVERVGAPQPLQFEIEREKIAVDPVSFFGMLNNGVGYIKLNSFTINSSAEVKKALLNLRANNQLNGLVLDLRDNGGGLLNEAVNIVNLFVKKNELVVSTKGKQKDKNHSYRTTIDPIEPELPLAVLVNGMSASASEIVAGALQDLDRAVIIGKRTFGKGLVQNSFPLMYNTQVKVTVAKYYIPSGRCIQEIDYAHKNAEGNAGNIPDSLITAFKTHNGRTVYDGKGILPDVLTDTNQISTVTFNLITQYLIFDFATKYVSSKSSIDPARNFKLTDREYDDFIAFTKSKNFDYKTVTGAELEKLKQAAEFEKNWDEIKPLYTSLQATLAASKSADLMKHKSEIAEILQEEIVSRYYFQKGRIEAGLSYDTDLLKTLDILTDRPTYSSVLNGSYKAANKTSTPGQN